MSDDMPDLELRIGAVAHGGHCVARHEGRVVFVRHAVPGEVVMVRLTEHDDGARFWRGDAVDVVQASEHRVHHPWPLADSLLAALRGEVPVGGAEFGHIVLDHQRRLKGGIFAEQLSRLAKLERDVEVEAVPDEHPDGLHWRTRAGFAVTPAGHLAMHAHRSEQLIPVADMPLAVNAINSLALWTVNFSGIQRVNVAAGDPSDPPLVILTAAPEADRAAVDAVADQIPDASVALHDPATGGIGLIHGRTWLRESIPGHRYRVTGEGFWQIHRSAPAVLVGAVLDGLGIEPGERVADLYAGAGLFSAPLAAAAGTGGSVLSIEGSERASKDARRNLHAQPRVDIVHGVVERVLRARQPELDVVVLDPPRAGAGRETVEQIIAAAPRAVGYVSCDPASFARDVDYFRRGGWELDTLRVFDLYPHTHHMEAFGVLRPL